MISDWPALYIATLGTVCILQTGLIGWLIWLNSSLIDEARVLHDLLEDTAAIPLDLPLTKDRK